MSRHSSAFNFGFIRNLLSRRRDISRYAAKEDFKFGFQTMFFSASSCGNFGSIGHRTLRRNSCIGRNSIATLPTFFIEEGFVFEPDKFFRVRSDNGGILDGGTTTKTAY